MTKKQNIANKTMCCVLDAICVSKRTNDLLLWSAKTVLALLYLMALLIDWDKTLDNWGLLK